MGIEKKKPGHKYFYAQYNPDMGDDDFDNFIQTDKSKRNERTIILSKFPVKFYNMVFKYKN